MHLDFKVRPFNEEEDYKYLVPFWNAYNFAPPPLKYLPGGLVVTLFDMIVCAGFLYETATPIAWMEWVVANPDLVRDVRNEGLNLLITSLKEMAKEVAVEVIYTTSNLDPYIKRLEDNKFIKTETASLLIYKG